MKKVDENNLSEKETEKVETKELAEVSAETEVKAEAEENKELSVSEEKPSEIKEAETEDKALAEKESEEKPEKEPEDPKAKSVKKKAIVSEALDWLRVICIGIIAGVLLVVFVIQRDNVYGDSMSPTLESGDVLFTQKISTYIKKYDRGDIVVLNGQNMEGYNKSEYLIKRIVGLPGETVKIADGNVYIKPMGHNDYYILQENYLQEGVKTTMMDYGTAHGYNEIKLGDNEYFCLGDNRPVSNDSRNLGPFTEDRIVAVAVIRIFPFNMIRTF